MLKLWKLLKKNALYPEESFKNISDEAKDLLKHMICDADKRFNVNQIIEHNWLVKLFLIVKKF